MIQTVRVGNENYFIELDNLIGEIIRAQYREGMIVAKGLKSHELASCCTVHTVLPTSS